MEHFRWDCGQLGAPAVALTLAGTGLIGAPDELQVYYANILWQRQRQQRRNYVSAQRNVTRNWNMCRNVIDFLAEQRKEQREEGGKGVRRLAARQRGVANSPTITRRWQRRRRRQL